MRLDLHRSNRGIGFLLPVVLIAALVTVLGGASVAAEPAAVSGAGLPGTASASSVAGGAGPALAFDGDRATSWTAGTVGEAWLEWDLGAH